MALRAVNEVPDKRRLVSRLWPQVKEATGIVQMDVFNRYRDVCRDFGIEPKNQPNAIGAWLRGDHEPDLEDGLVILMVFAEALEKNEATIDDPLFGGSPGNRTLNLRIADPLY